LKNSSNRGSCQEVNIVYVTSCSEDSLLRGAHAISAALFLSNGIRYWVSLRVVLRVKRRQECLVSLVRISGREIRWLRPGERNLLGFLNTLFKGRSWPGARLIHLKEPSYDELVPSSCLPIGEYLGSPNMCPECILVDEEKLEACLKPWWLLASLMVVNDAGCRQRCG